MSVLFILWFLFISFLITISYKKYQKKIVTHVSSLHFTTFKPLSRYNLPLFIYWLRYASCCSAGSGRLWGWSAGELQESKYLILILSTLSTDIFNWNFVVNYDKLCWFILLLLLPYFPCLCLSTYLYISLCLSFSLTLSFSLSLSECKTWSPFTSHSRSHFFSFSLILIFSHTHSYSFSLSFKFLFILINSSICIPILYSTLYSLHLKTFFTNFTF